MSGVRIPIGPIEQIPKAKHIAAAAISGTIPVARCKCGWEQECRSGRAAQELAQHHERRP